MPQVQQYIFDDGSVIGWDDTGLFQSKEIGSNAWVDDPSPATVGWSVFNQDIVEQNRLGTGYPQNGKSWDANAATLGVTRLIDTAVRAYATVKGSTPATYAGQDGRTYSNGQRLPAGQPQPGGIGPLLLIAAAFFLMA